MKARFQSTCPLCGSVIKPGDEIEKHGRKYAHVDCTTEQARSDGETRDDHEDPEQSWPPPASVLRSDLDLGRRGLIVIRFSSGAVMTQNSRGRCEDAPCCGCCS